MDEKKFKEWTDKADQAFEDLRKSVENKADVETIENLKGDFQSVVENAMKIEDKNLVEYVKSVQEHANTLEERVQDIVQKAQKSVKHPEEMLDEYFSADEWKQSVKAFKNGERPRAKVLTVANDLTAGTTSPVILPSREPGVEFAPRADTPIYNLIAKGATDKDKVSWIERTLASESAGTAMKAENNAFGESDALWTEVEASVKKITDMFKVTNEMLEDTEFVRSEIMSMLTTNIPHLRETEILTGTNASTTMNGLVTAATAFSLPSGISAADDPNAVDGLRAAITQVRLGYNGSNAYTKGYEPDAIVLNPVDAHNIGSLKDADGNWLLPGWFMGTKAIDGIRVVESTDMTSGSYLVGRIAAQKYYTRRGLVVKFWDQYDTDPAYDRVLFTATERGCVKVSNISAYGLVTGTIAAAVAAVTA